MRPTSVREGPVIRIAHLTNSFRRDGTGLTNSTIDLAVAQRLGGDQVSVLCGDMDDWSRALLERFGIRAAVDLAGHGPLDMVASARRYRGVLAQYDVLHAHTVRSFLILLLARGARGWWRSVVTIHNPHQRSSFIMYAARRVVALSSRQAAHIRRFTLLTRRPVVIWNGTLGTVRRPQISEVRPVELGAHSVLFVGALHRRKGLDILLEAMAVVVRSVPTARLVVIGNRDAPEFEAMARSLGDAVDFHGFEADPRGYMLGARVFVLPSREEGFGNVLVEARESGVPIVASDVGGIPEALNHGRAGLLVPPGDPASLAAALIRVLTDDATAASLRLAGRLDLETMRPERAAREYRSVYRSLSRRD